MHRGFVVSRLRYIEMWTVEEIPDEASEWWLHRGVYIVAMHQAYLGRASAELGKTFKLNLAEFFSKTV